jgi:hypothetical protein
MRIFFKKIFSQYDIYLFHRKALSRTRRTVAPNFFQKDFFSIRYIVDIKKRHSYDKLALISINLSILNNRLSGTLSVVGIPPEVIQLLMCV